MNVRWVRTALVAACALAYLVVWAGTAEAATPRQLLHRYQPVTVLDPLEQFAPTEVNGFVNDSVLEIQTAPKVWSVAQANPTLATLPTQPAQSCIDAGLAGDCYRLNQAACSPAAGTAGVACYSNAEQAGDPRSVVYARVARKPHKTVLEYWYFYYDDFYSYDYPPDDLFWQAHEGDWEVVSVVLDRGTQQPLYAAYSQHCTGERRAWHDVERSGSHPVDHVAIGSHANLFEAGSHPVATQCIPPAALQILAANGLPARGDRAGAGRSFGPASVAGVDPTAIRRVGSRRPGWFRFAGTWGEDQVFHAPPPIGTQVFLTSPISPPYQQVWRLPLTTFSQWPVG
jgi:hypothetical protein